MKNSPIKLNEDNKENSLPQTANLNVLQGEAVNLSLIFSSLDMQAIDEDDLSIHVDPLDEDYDFTDELGNNSQRKG